MPTPHKHAALIKAWADGATIQVWEKHLAQWQTVEDKYLSWRNEAQYRIKPQEPPYGEIAYHAWCLNSIPGAPSWDAAANAVIEAYKQWVKDNEPENDGG